MKAMSKREKEKQLVSEMIKLYCNKNHGTKGELCPNCKNLDEYAKKRSDNCPFMQSKTFCSNCHVHCYKADMRNMIKEVMKFSGPRMIFTHPTVVIRHMITSRKEKQKQTNMGR